MTIDAKDLPRESPSVSMGFPVTVGWTHAAMAINSSLRLGTAVNLTMHVEMHGPLLIDFKNHAFSWSTPLELFPVDAVHTGLETSPTVEDGPPFFELPGEDLDGLLWVMGINSFGGARAYWLPEGERYQLTRWPNLTRHNHTMRQMQMIAVLGNTSATTKELATVVGVEESEAQSLVNALSLMGVLYRSTAEPEVAIVKPTAAAKRKSLFGRLLKRLGR